MKIGYRGYKAWKHIFEELGIFTYYIFPTIVIHHDRAYEENEYRTEIRIAWLFFEISFYI